MKQQMIRSLTFQNNQAEAAMNFYIALFENSTIINIKRWAKGGRKNHASNIRVGW